MTRSKNLVRTALRSIRRGQLAAMLCCLLTSAALAAPVHVVINEVMYHPPGDRENLQYLELYNPAREACDLSGWTFTKGVKFAFPKATKLPPGGYLILCRDRAAFLQQYGNDLPVAGEFTGHLSHNGEHLELSDAEKQVVDAMKYKDTAPWPVSADGHSVSLERICPLAPGDEPSNWDASRPPDIETPSGTPGRVNDSFSPNPPPLISDIALKPIAPIAGKPATVEAIVSDPDGIKDVTLSYQVIQAGHPSEPRSLIMKRVSGDTHKGHYLATLPAQPADRLIRYRIQASDATGATRALPSQNDLRTAWTYSTFTNTNTAKIPFGFILRPDGKPPQQNQFAYRAQNPTHARGRDAFIYMPPNGGEVQAFDFIKTGRRKGGYKVHFLKDQTLRGMTSVSIIFEDSPRYALTEALSYEVYRLAGVPAEMTEHLRLFVDGEPRGYHMMIEQPNKAFLARNDRGTDGNLYKLIWYEDDIARKHEKKTNLTSGHDDLRATLDALKTGDAAQQWDYIQKNFNVEEFINYYAVNMCIQNWDGFANNYFLYHDGARWEIYPWDEDKTWGDYDGASPKFDWYQMPLESGMNGYQRPAALGGPVAGTSVNVFREWWRPPGLISGPLLANPRFRERFLTRLREVCTTVFTKEKVFPLIDAMEKRLEAEVPARALISGENKVNATALFSSNIQSLRDQLINRRKFILDELDRQQR